LKIKKITQAFHGEVNADLPLDDELDGDFKKIIKKGKIDTGDDFDFGGF
jgi:hypothetical protein